MTRDRGARQWVLEGVQWLHRPWWKVAINAMLRLVQPQPRKFVVFSRCVFPEGERPRCTGYGFGLVLHTG